MPEGGQLLPGSVIRHYRRGHLVLPGVLPGVTWSVTWCYLGVAWCYRVLPGSLFWAFLCGPKVSAFGTSIGSNSKIWKQINFHQEMLLGPTPVVVTCLPDPPSEVSRSVHVRDQAIRTRLEPEGGAGHVSCACPEGRLLYRTCVLYLSYTCPVGEPAYCPKCPATPLKSLCTKDRAE